MNRSVNASSTQQGRIGRVDNRVYPLFRDIAQCKFYMIIHQGIPFIMIG
jgi:hypothetical protein